MRPRYADGMGTEFVGRLVDPATGRQVLSCETCGEPVWLDPTPCIVSTMCERCANHCARCGTRVEWSQDIASHEHGGRPLCEACWEAPASRKGGMS